jgi:hypothetical protein
MMLFVGLLYIVIQNLLLRQLYQYKKVITIINVRIFIVFGVGKCRYILQFISLEKALKHRKHVSAIRIKNLFML